MKILNHFVIVLTDTCTTDNTRYVVNTSISGFIYKVEVYKDEVLVNAVKINCVTEYSQEINPDFFLDKYQQAHKKMRQQYCHVAKADISNIEPSFEKKDTHTLKKSVASIVILGVLTYLFITQIFIYTDIYINIFFSQKVDQLAYLEKVEEKTHKLEKACMLLAKKEKSIAKIHECQTWCDKRIIAKEQCDLFLAYFYVKPHKVQMDEDKNTTDKLYSLSPEQDIIELQASKIFKLKVHNESNHHISVVLKDIILENSNNEEIVQFKEAKTSFMLAQKEEKSFYIYLEPSYYKQFPPTKYSGYLLFDVSYKNNIVASIKKAFYFVVQ